MKTYEQVAASVLQRVEEHERRQERRGAALRRLGACLSVLVLVVATTALVGTGYVFAAGMGFVEDYFGLFISRSGAQLSEAQREYLETAAAAIGESVTCGDATVTVRSAITDGDICYIYMDLEAPEDISLEALNGKGLGFEEHTLRSDSTARHPVHSSSMTFIPVEDNDGKANTISMVLRATVMSAQDSTFSFADGHTRTLTLQNMSAYKDTFPFNQYRLTEGTWSFRFRFSPVGDNAQQELELLQEPVVCIGERMSGKPIGVNMYSIRLGALGMTLRYSYDPGVLPEAVDFGQIRMVLRDGSEILAQPHGGVMGSCMYLFDAPVVISQIDHIIINDITRVNVD